MMNIMRNWTGQPAQVPRSVAANPSYQRVPEPQKLMQAEDRIDLLINNAGFGVAPVGTEPVPMLGRSQAWVRQE
jgi:hypothetical protein